MEPVSFDQYNQQINGWVSSTRAKMRQSIASLTSAGKGELVRSLIGRTRQNYGATESIVFNFNRYGVFFHKGVGRGYIMLGNKVIRGSNWDSKILMRRTMKQGEKERNPVSRLNSGSGSGIPRNRESKGRIPREWFNPVLDSEFPKLADMVAEMRADMALDSVGIKMK
jgi:hypothetical protein